MTKTYINNAIVGNSRMLGCITDRGELVRLFWPNIDYPQHVEKMTAGVFFTGCRDSTTWLDEDNWMHHQYYIQDTNILETICVNKEKGLRVVQIDYVLPDRDVMLRQYEVENIAGYDIDIGFVVYSSGVTSTNELRSTLFDFRYDALVHYRHGYYISVSADREVYQFQLGNNAYDSARSTELRGYDSIGMMQDGAVSWKLGVFRPGERKKLVVHICASDTLKGVKKLVHDAKNSCALDEYKRTQEYWKSFLEGARQINTGIREIDSLYKRSLLVFKLMSDEKTGGLLAAPEIDEGFTKCGRYAYCWGRDAAFITGALDRCGLTGAVDKFYEWAVEVQDEDGSWQQRYHMDGNLAPSWGLQVDETGTLLWGMLKHYEITKDREFLVKMRRSVEKGVEFLLGFIDRATGLPAPSFDLWEERFGEHAYSSAAVYGGIMAAAQIGRVLEMPEEIILRWTAAADKIKEAMERSFWKPDRNCFIRSVRTKMNPWGGEYSPDTAIVQVNPKGYMRDVTLEDGTVDVSLLGMVVPFDVFDAGDDRMRSTVEMMERVLGSSAAGGIKRYESDNYIGGNPWVLATLWVALYHIQRKDFDKAEKYFQWAVKSRTELDLLPEQVNRDNGRPEWVIPLTWSHAMFVLTLVELVEAGVL